MDKYTDVWRDVVPQLQVALAHSPAKGTRARGARLTRKKLQLFSGVGAHSQSCVRPDPGFLTDSALQVVQMAPRACSFRTATTKVSISWRVL